MKQKPKQRISFMERIRRGLRSLTQRQEELYRSKEHYRWATGWKRNALYKGKPLTRSMIRRVGSKERAIELGLFTA